MTLNLIFSWKDILIGSGIGISVVFIALTLLIFAFIGLSKLIKFKQEIGRNKKSVKVTPPISSNSSDIPAEVSAAIGLAIALYFSEEKDIITIKHIEGRYSPWNSKKYGLTN